MAVHLFRTFAADLDKETGNPFGEFHNFVRAQTATPEYDHRNIYTLYPSAMVAEPLYGQVFALVNGYGSPILRIGTSFEEATQLFPGLSDAVKKVCDLKSALTAQLTVEQENVPEFKEWKHLSAWDYNEPRPANLITIVQAHMADDEEYLDTIDAFCTAAIRLTQVSDVLTFQEWFDNASVGQARKTLEKYFMGKFFFNSWVI
jgi:hypothetical protein